MIEISIIHPSRQRAKQAGETATKWLDSAYYPANIEYLLSLDNSDKTVKDYANFLFHLETEYDILQVMHDNKTAIEAINNAAKLAKGRILIVVSDDFDCLPGWDEKLFKYLDHKKDFVVKTADGLQPWLITLPIMDRKYYERFGYIYHPGYQHLFCDTEMTCVGDLLGRVIKVPVLFEHLHYSTGKSKKDNISEKNDSSWAQGEKLFIERLQNKFDLKPSDIKGEINCDPNHKSWFRQKGVII